MAKKHYVVCVKCGRQFDASWGAYYNASTRRYTCRRCARAQKANAREKAADVRETRTGMRQSLGAMIAKLVFGGLFILSSFTMSSAAEVLTGLLIGGGLIAWGLVPWLQAKRKAQDEQEQAAIAAWTQQERARVEAERSLQKPRLCPYCGATTKGANCEYCGQPLPLDGEGTGK